MRTQSLSRGAQTGRIDYRRLLRVTLISQIEDRSSKIFVKTCWASISTHMTGAVSYQRELLPMTIATARLCDRAQLQIAVVAFESLDALIKGHLALQHRLRSICRSTLSLGNGNDSRGLSG